MATATENHGARQITAITPVDLTGVRDAGIKALVLLAASLGWNVVQKHNNPIVLVSRDGTQKRLPTNTSVRMSVYQSALSTIMVHSEGYEPTLDLIDAIVKETKIDRDHERRMRLAFGETRQEHRDRLTAIEAESKGTAEPQPLTTRIELPMVDEQVEQILSDHETEPPRDGGDHGKLISVKTFQAHYKASRAMGTSMLYESDTSNERVWEDGYKDYECKVCGKVYSTPRGVGSHKQCHIRDGDIPKPTASAWQRSEHVGIETNYVPKSRRRSKVEMEAERKLAEEVEKLDVASLDFVDELPNDEAMQPESYEPPAIEAKEASIVPATRSEDILDQIADLVLPRIIAANEVEMDELRAENQRLREALDKITANWNALKEMLSGE